MPDAGLPPQTIFHSTATHYARFRPQYPPEMLAHLAKRLRWTGDQRIMDLGCGPGHLAVPLSSHVREVIAVDPDEEMIAEGSKLSALVGASNVTWITGASGNLNASSLPPLNAVVMGASFHWMDRAAVLDVLDGLLTDDGAVVLIGAGSPLGMAEPPWWEAVVADVRTRWLGPARRAGSGRYEHPTKRHEDYLAESAFSVMEPSRWTQQIVRSLDDVVGLQMSFSYSAPALFGDGLHAYVAELRQALITARPTDGRFAGEEVIDMIIATRPGERAATSARPRTLRACWPVGRR